MAWQVQGGLKPTNTIFTVLDCQRHKQTSQAKRSIELWLKQWTYSMALKSQPSPGFRTYRPTPASQWMLALARHDPQPHFKNLHVEQPKVTPFRQLR